MSQGWPGILLTREFVDQGSYSGYLFLHLVMIIELDDFYEFNQSLYQADVELDGQIQSMIEDFIEEEGAEELCLEDIYLAMIEGDKTSDIFEYFRIKNFHRGFFLRWF